MKKIVSILLFIILYSNNIFSQSQGIVYKKHTNAIIKQYGLNIKYPWLGGMNSLQITMGDLNNDGKKDIVAFDYINNKIFPFISNSNASGVIDYNYNELFAANFPPVIYYLFLKDYNCDGIPDLFHKGYAGVAVYKGYYQNNELKFTFYKDLFHPGFPGPVNVYVQPTDIPSIVDMDNDGDLDVISFDVLGNFITSYKNLRVENNQPCDSITIILETTCWGKVAQNNNKIEYTTNITCKGSVPKTPIAYGDDIGIDESPNDILTTDDPLGGKEKRHAGNCMLHFDEDGDGDVDMIGSNIIMNGVQLLRNGGNATIGAVITNQDTIFKTGNPNPVFLPQFIAISGEDVNNDGKMDLIFSSHQERTSTQSFHNNVLKYYPNTSTTTVTDFNLASDSLLFDQTIDIGLNSFPTFFDYNKDGKKDLFVGGTGTMDTTTFQALGKISYYKNTSTPGNISFELVTKDFLNLSAKKYKGLYPTFADATGEGIIDLILGNNNGQLTLYKNIAVSNGNIPNYQWITDSFANVKLLGDYAAPAMFDINFDGRKDLIVGSASGILHYYEDTSSQFNISAFDYKTANLGAVNVGSLGYASPIFTKLDSTNHVYLLVGNRQGFLTRYDSLSSYIYSTYPKIDSAYSLIKEIQRSVPAVADIDADGKYDMIVGNKMGGLSLYKQELMIGPIDTTGIDPVDTLIDSTVSIQTITKDKSIFNIWPNPTRQTVFVSCEIWGLNNVLELYNIQGQKIFISKIFTSKYSTISLPNIPTGIYYYKLFNEKYYTKGHLKIE